MEEITIKFCKEDDMSEFLRDWRFIDWVNDGEITFKVLDYKTVIIKFTSISDRLTFQAVTDLLDYYVFFN